MKKFLFSMFILFGLSLQANLSSDGLSEYKMGNYKKARELFTQACDAGDAQGCYYAGYLYENANGLKTDYKKSSELYSKACSGGNIGALTWQLCTSRDEALKKITLKPKIYI